MTSDDFSLDRTLLSFRDGTGETRLTIGDSFRNAFICGNTGSGKSTSTGSLIFSKMVSLRYGMLCLCVKDNEAERLISYCKEVGREADIIRVGADSEHKFDFLNYVSKPHYHGKTITSNIVAVLKSVLNTESQAGGRQNEDYWENAVTELITNTIDLCLLSEGQVTVDQMYQIVSTAPKSESAPLDKMFDMQFMDIMLAAKLTVDREVFSYIDALSNPEKERLKDPAVFGREINRRFESVRTLGRIDKFFFHSYKSLSTKTRGIVESSFSGFLFKLLQQPLYSLFCSGESTFSPEDALAGKIIILDIPVLTYGKAGQSVQRLFKEIFQSAMQRRNLNENNRPIVIWADEGDMLLLEGDPAFLATCREKRISNVIISQNISKFHYNMGGDGAHHRVNSLLSLLSTKIMHCNDHLETNEWASRLIGEAYTEDEGQSNTLSGGPETFSSSRSQSYKLERMVRPEAFLDLTIGGPPHFTAEAYVILQGKAFNDGFHHRKVTFKQKF